MKSNLNRNKKRVLVLLFLFLIGFDVMAMPNPASANCIKMGGKLEIRTRGDGGQYGVCLFEDNRQCDEWALFRGECPVGGIKITGYTTPEQIYCVLQGGKTFAVEDESSSKCIFPNGSSCLVLDFFNGRCDKKVA